SRRQTHHRHAAPPRQGAIGSPLKLNRDERRWGRPRERPGRGVLLDPFPKQVRVDPVFERKSRYRNARLKTTRDKTLLRCRLVAPATVPTNKPDPQFLIIVCHHKVSTYFGGHLMHQSTQKQKVQGNSRLRIAATFQALLDDLVSRGRDPAVPRLLSVVEGDLPHLRFGRHDPALPDLQGAQTSWNACRKSIMRPPVGCCANLGAR
ncbi:hypothetical protein ABIB75_007464, partial [Bradyrhizobium sp. GM2.2]